VQRRARAAQVRGNGRLGDARTVPRAARTWRGCLLTQLHLERLRESACERMMQKGLRQAKTAEMRRAAVAGGSGMVL
jgi:hypothetical protein